MEAVKEAIKNGARPDDIMAQIAALLQEAGYAGLDVFAVAPRTGELVSMINFLPDRWGTKLVLVKNGNQLDNPGDLQQK